MDEKIFESVLATKAFLSECREDATKAESLREHCKSEGVSELWLNLALESDKDVSQDLAATMLQTACHKAVEKTIDPADLEIAKGEFLDLMKSHGRDYNEKDDSFSVRYDADFGSLDDAGEFTAIDKASDSSKDFQATDAEYQLMSKYTKLPKEQFKVYHTISATAELDRHHEKFAPKALENMAKSAMGAPLIKDHNKSASDGIIGKIFDGGVKTIDGKKYLAQKVMVHNTPENKAAIDGFESGINNKLSVGARVKRDDYKCDICAKAMYQSPIAARKSGGSYWCGHNAGMETEDKGIATATIMDAEMRELSRVTVPAQPPAAVMRGKSEEDTQPVTDVITAKSEEPAQDPEQGSEKSDPILPENQDLGDENVDFEKLSEALNANVEQLVAKLEEKNAEKHEALIAKYDEQIAKANELIELQKQAIEKLAAPVIALEGRQEAFEKEMGVRIEEVRGAFDAQSSMLAAQTENLNKFIEHANKLTGLSVQDAQRLDKATINVGTTQTAEDKKKQTKADACTSFVQRFVQ